MINPILKYIRNENSLTVEDSYVLPKYTIIIGKNNSGKSWLLKSIFNKLDKGQEPFNVYYVSPERFGALERNTGLEDASYSDTLGRDRQKLKNQSGDFITEAISKFNGLIAQLNRTPSQKNKKIKVKFLESLNNKIPNIVFSYTTSEESTPFHFKINDKFINPNSDNFSSGTNQVIALMTSVMYFIYSGKYTKEATLLLDEPDVHIHP
ncbi:MAG: ATP-binding protein, partial [Thermoproteota archaeon]|nr:ATP-binding protein [Thermoproteota archaeon]